MRAGESDLAVRHHCAPCARPMYRQTLTKKAEKAGADDALVMIDACAHGREQRIAGGLNVVMEDRFDLAAGVKHIGAINFGAVVGPHAQQVGRIQIRTGNHRGHGKGSDTGNNA